MMQRAAKTNSGMFLMAPIKLNMSLFISVWLDLEKYFTGTLSFEWVEWGDLEYY